MNESERALLEQARQALSPTGARRDALRARIDAAIATPPAAPPGRGASFGLRMLAVGVAVGLGAGGFALFGGTPSSPPEAAPEISAPARDVPAPPVEPVPAPLVHAPEPASATSAPSAAPEATPPTARRRPAEDPSDGLAREIALVGEARRALARGDGVAANEALERHAREFPEGELAEERGALSVLAWCAAGSEERAAAAARAFLARHPTSLSLARVRASCAGGAL